MIRCALISLTATLTFLNSADVAGQVAPVAARSSSLTSAALQQVEQAAGLIRTATVRILSGTDRCSGVIVSEHGHVLTTAHGLHVKGDVQSGDPNGGQLITRDSRDPEVRDPEVTVVLDDGRRLFADVLLCDQDQDVAVVQLRMDAETANRMKVRTVLRPALSDHVLPGTVVLAAGCPGKDDDGAGPVVRLGTVRGADRRQFRTSCILTAGDSGGPMVNLSGQLVGLHHRISAGTTGNVHLRCDSLPASVWKLCGVSLQQASPEVTSSGSASLRPGELVSRRLRELTVRVLITGQGDSNGEDSVVASGTRLSDVHVATRLSSLRGIPLTFSEKPLIAVNLSSGATVPCRIANTDVSLDLCILKHERLSGSPLHTELSLPQFGQIVYCAPDAEGTLVARINWTEPRTDNRIGVRLNGVARDTVTVTEVFPGTAASQARVAVNDQLMEINSTPIRKLSDVAAAVRPLQPGDWVRFRLQRDGMEMASTGQLTHDALTTFERTEFLDGLAGQLSDRRTGFARVIQHGAVLSPPEYGGPVLDHSGRLVGINIARRSREASLAIPIDRAEELMATE
ncbi:MAG: trypsin-like peptidase domain-containing protein [Planctomycetaceae bacterium]|nr:trypsin-like peptidase domain-containing protein [Planctomycetaceae bacterium]